MSAMPEFVDPMLATLVAAPFDDPDWLFEIKWDGFRVEAVVRAGEVRLWTRGQKDAEGYFGPFLTPPTWIDAREAIVDGEVIAFGRDGEPDFALLQERIRRRKVEHPATGGLVYQVFDLLWLDGRSLAALPLDERKAFLKGVLRKDPRVRLSDHIETHGTAFYEAAKTRGLEGIMAKERHSLYLPGIRSAAWQKVKIRPEQELVVGGWNPGKGTAADLGALHVGIYEGDALRYAGKIGAGFTGTSRAELLAALAPLTTECSAIRAAPATAAAQRHDVGRALARDPGRVRGLDRRRARAPGELQGARPRQGPSARGPRGAGRRPGLIRAVASGPPPTRRPIGFD